jgi:hypothetical protein
MSMCLMPVTCSTEQSNKLCLHSQNEVLPQHSIIWLELPEAADSLLCRGYNDAFHCYQSAALCPIGRDMVRSCSWRNSLNPDFIEGWCMHRRWNQPKGKSNEYHCCHSPSASCQRKSNENNFGTCIKKSPRS